MSRKAWPKGPGSRIWWRAYVDSLDDPKIQTLPDKLFKAWYNVCCVSARNDGNPFPMTAVSFGLRVSIVEAVAIIRDLTAAGLIDHFDGDLFLSHGWHKRQYKTDKVDPTNNHRKKKHRSRKSSTGTVNDVDDGTEDGTLDAVPPTVPKPVPVATPMEHTEQSRADKSHDHQGTRARAGAIQPEANELANAIAKVAGYTDRHTWPDGWHGSALVCDGWLVKGWKYEIILNSCERQLKQMAPHIPGNFHYFAKGIAKDHAQHAQPLPIVKLEGEIIHVPAAAVASKPGSLAEATRKVAREGLRFGPRPTLTPSVECDGE